MTAQPCGLRPHTHVHRQAVIQQLIPLWQEKFGDNLLAIAACASFARGADVSYSDLEVGVYLKEPLPSGEDRFLQRIVDGMLIEAIYYTPQQYIKEVTEVGKDWYVAASDIMVGVYNPDFIEDLVRQVRAVQVPAEAYLHQAAEYRYELQEGFGKLLNAVEQNNIEGISLLLADAVLFLLRTLATLNRQPFTTFARFIREARRLPVKPERMDELLDLLVQGSYQNLPYVGEVSLAVFASLEQIFAQRGIQLFDDPLDPCLPNRKFGSG
jgi:predicted nucleotidyltransferase